MNTVKLSAQRGVHTFHQHAVSFIQHPWQCRCRSCLLYIFAMGGNTAFASFHSGIGNLYFLMKYLLFPFIHAFIGSLNLPYFCIGVLYTLKVLIFSSVYCKYFLHVCDWLTFLCNFCYCAHFNFYVAKWISVFVYGFRLSNLESPFSSKIEIFFCIA